MGGKRLLGGAGGTGCWGRRWFDWIWVFVFWVGEGGGEADEVPGFVRGGGGGEPGLGEYEMARLIYRTGEGAGLEGFAGWVLG